MCKYRVRTYKGTMWSLVTQADHFEDYFIDSEESLPEIAERLAQKGFSSGDARKWIMPGAILTVEIQ